MKILIIKNDGIGDLILSSGIITFLAKNLCTKLDLLTCIQNKEIASYIEGINKFHFVSRDSIKQYSILNINRIKIPFRKANDKAKIVRFSISEQTTINEINQENYDLIIVLRRYVRQSSLHLLNNIKAKNKLCMWEYPTNLSHTSAHELSKDSIHLTSRNLNKFIKTELEYYEAVLSLYFQQRIHSNPSLTLKYTNQNPIKKSIGLIICGASVNISYDKWLKLCEYLIEKNYTVYLFGDKEQINDAIKIAKISKNISNFVGQLKFKDYPKIFSSLEFIIGNDTGLTHFASLYNKNIIVLLGGGTFGSFFPWREKEPQKVIYNYLNCYYCLWNCTNENKFRCISSLFEKNFIFNQLDKYIS